MLYDSANDNQSNQVTQSIAATASEFFTGIRIKLGLKWKKDKETSGTIKIISEQGEVVGEIRFNFNNKKERD